jgi:hypothetical protein
MLIERFGEIEDSHGPIPFTFTDYYSKEMGAQLQKTYLIFKQSIDRDQLADIKLFSNSIEGEYSASGRRNVNIDPGYIARDKLVLASTKDFYHRLYLGKGIYGEVTLHYRLGKYRYFSWTYPDYKEESFYKWLGKVRGALVKELRGRIA